MRGNRLTHGFSLIELMVAAMIMGTVISVALPRYRVFIARGRMSEAKANLGVLATLQQSYYAEYQKNVGMTKVGGGGANNACITCSGATNANKGQCNELGFRPSDCNRLRYFYVSGTDTSGANANENVHSNVREIYPGCENNGNVYDQWHIYNKNRNLGHSYDVVERCNN